MPILVTGPDGVEHEFPDGTSDDVIKGVMSRTYGTPQAPATPFSSDNLSPGVPAPFKAPSLDGLSPTGALAPATPFDALKMKSPFAAGVLNATDATVEGLLDMSRLAAAAPDLPAHALDLAARLPNIPGSPFNALPEDLNTPKLNLAEPLVDAPKRALDEGLQAFGVPDVNRDQLSGSDKFLNTAANIAGPGLITLGATGAAGAAGAGGKTAGGVFARDVAERLAARPLRAASSEVAAGVGGAVGQELVDRTDIPFVPEPLEQLAATLFGTAGAGISNDAAFSLVDALSGASRERFLARYLQSAAQDPASAASNIGDVKQAAEGLQTPFPDALLSSNDPGLIGVSRGLRNRAGAKNDLTTNDRRVQEGVAMSLDGMVDKGADLRAPQNLARDQRDALRASNAERVAGAERANADAIAEAAQPSAGDQILESQRAIDPLGANASREADEIITAELDARTTRRNEVRQGVKQSREPVNTAYMRPVLQEMRRDATRGINPGNRVPLDALYRFEALAGQGRVPIGRIEELRLELSSMHAQARNAGNFQLADNIARLQGLVNDATDNVRMRVDPTAIPSAGGRVTGPGAAEAVRRFEREHFLPFFGRESAGGDFRKAVQRDNDRVNTPPGETLGRFFLRPGAGSEGAAQDLKNILELSPNEAAGKDAVRRYFLASASRSVRDGRINSTTLRKWLDSNRQALRPYPEVERDIRSILSDTVNKRATDSARVTAAREELVRISADAKLSEQEFQRSVAQVFLDNDPDNAVSAIFSAKDRAKRMDEALALVESNPDAARGFKASVAKWLQNSVEGGQISKTGSEKGPVVFQRLRAVTKEHRNTLSRVFSPEEMQALDDMQKVLEVYPRLAGVRATGGSETAENIDLGLLGPILRAKYGILKGGGIMRITNELLNRARKFAGADAKALDARFDQALLEAATDPAKAIHLLNYKDTKEWRGRFAQLFAYEGALEDDEKE